MGSEESTGTVRIAAFPTVARALLPRALVGLRDAHPGLEPALVEAEPEASLSAVGLGTVDVAVAHEYDLFPERDTQTLHRTELLTDPLFLVSADGSGEPVRLAHFAASRWILPPPDTACGRLVERACGLAGFEPRPLATSYDFAVACALAAAGHGVALVRSSGSSLGSRRARSPTSRSGGGSSRPCGRAPSAVRPSPRCSAR